MNAPPWPALLASLLTIGVLPAQDATVAPRLVVDDAMVRAWLDELVPAVEEAAGEKFTTSPQVVLSDPAEVGKALTADFAVQMRSLFGDDEEETVGVLARQQGAAHAGSLLGKYGFESRVLYLMPEQLAAHVDLYRIDPGLGEDLFRLVIAHELVHALQDQVLDLRARLRRIENQDRALGLSCLIEGHAVLCSERVGRALGLDAAISELRRMMTTDPRTESTQASLAFALRSQRLIPRTLYETATAFMEFHHAEGSTSRLWEILRAPSPPTRVIFVPERFGESRPAPRDLAFALEGVPELLGSSSWTVARGAVGELTLRSENAGAAEGWLESVLDGLRGGAFVEMQRGTANLRRSVYALEFADAAAATAFTDLVIAAAHVDRLAIEENAVLRDRAEVTIAPFGAPDGCWATSYRQRPTTMSAMVRGEVVWFRRGPFVVQVTVVGVRSDDEVVAGVAAAVLERLESQ